MIEWEYTSENIAPSENWHDELRWRGRDGWEAWHMEKDERGWRTIYFKRPVAP